jgi:hypothetical protein
MKKVIWSGILPVVVTGLIGSSVPINAPNTEKTVPEISKTSADKAQPVLVAKKAKKKYKETILSKMKEASNKGLG